MFKNEITCYDGDENITFKITKEHPWVKKALGFVLIVIALEFLLTEISYRQTDKSSDLRVLTPIFTTPTPIVQLANPVTPSLETPPPPITFEASPETLSAPPSQKGPQKEHCVTIDGTNPPGVQGDGLAPTAFSAWLELGKPPKVEYKPRGGESVETNGFNLPHTVHPGDKICVPPTQP